MLEIKPPSVTTKSHSKGAAVLHVKSCVVFAEAVATTSRRRLVLQETFLDSSDFLFQSSSFDALQVLEQGRARVGVISSAKILCVAAEKPEIFRIFFVFLLRVQLA